VKVRSVLCCALALVAWSVVRSQNAPLKLNVTLKAVANPKAKPSDKATQVDPKKGLWTINRVDGEVLISGIKGIENDRLLLDKKKPPLALVDVDVIQFQPVQPVNIGKQMALLTYAIYEGTWKKLPDLDKLTPSQTGIEKLFRIPTENRSDDFVIRFRGRVRIPQSDTYTFSFRSRSPGKLIIDGNTVAEIEKGSGQQEKEGSLELSSGTYSIELQCLCVKRSFYAYVNMHDHNKNRISLTSRLVLSEVEPARSLTGLVEVSLAHGDRLTGKLVDWTEGRVTLHLGGDVKRAVTLPEALVRTIRFTGTRMAVPDTLSETDDRVVVYQQDQFISLSGLCLGIADGKLRLRYKDEERKLDLDKVSAITLAPRDAANSPAPPETLYHAFGLVNRDRISGTWNDLKDKQVSLTSFWGADITVPLDDLAFIETRNGRITYISDLEPVQTNEVAFLDRLMSYRRDQSLLGTPLRLEGKILRKGLAVHAYSALTYDLAGQYDSFKVKVGFQDPEGRSGRAVVRVLGDDKILYEQIDARGDRGPEKVAISVVGVNRITLEVDYGKNQDVSDQVVWGNARLLRRLKTEASGE